MNMEIKKDYLVKTTFRNNDCIYLLKDLSDIIKEVTIEEKEALIAQGVNYSEMISKEYPVSNEINKIFEILLSAKASDLANYTAKICQYLYKQNKENTIIVSLARAGSPIGALMKRYFKFKYNIDIPHYSISIIRGKGIDENALNHIRENHPNGIMAFVDGWTGKGSISNELKSAVSKYNISRGTNISSDLVVLADPARIAAIAGTRDDICIPNACLNSTISGLVSRTIHNRLYIGNDDYHGAVRYDNLAYQDLTGYFLNVVASAFYDCASEEMPVRGASCVDTLKAKLANDFPLSDIHKVKLSIGESSRALLRRVPYVVLVKNPDNPDLNFVLHLARKKGVEIIQYDTLDYECVTLLH
jgi:hypothetical protein